jgi:hypothetical protein
VEAWVIVALSTMTRLAPRPAARPEGAMPALSREARKHEGGHTIVTVPALDVAIARAGRVCVLAVGGELDIATVTALTQRAEAAVRQPLERLILDLSGLEFIDCTGVGALAA